MLERAFCRFDRFVQLLSLFLVHTFANFFTLVQQAFQAVLDLCIRPGSGIFRGILLSLPHRPVNLLPAHVAGTLDGDLLPFPGILTIPVVPVNQQSSAIAEYISEFIEDGSTLQLGIGAIPNAIAKLLVNKHNLGIHSEMFTENIIDLMEAGAVNNSQKTMHRFKSVACFAGGSEKLYKWLNRNPFVEFYPVSYTNDPVIIARQKKMVSINATMCVDLSGQACSESIGPKQYSGVGGQMDFNLGASMCPDGKAFLVVNSTAKTKDGVISTIVPTLAQGSFVSTGRNDIDYVVTEYGVAKLRGKTMRQRAEQLIAIAHPDYRKELLKEANRLFFI